jgi:hypothetical protein
VTVHRDVRDSVGIDRAAQPERRLMAAVLQRAVDDLRGSPQRRRRNALAPNRQVLRAAVSYVASSDRRWPFSFENLCEALRLEPRRVRRELRKPSPPLASGVAIHTVSSAEGAQVEARHPGDIPAT